MAETERTMLDRLNVRYSGRTRNGRWEGAKYLRAEHVPTGLRHSRNRICDFIATGMHSTPYVRDQQAAFPPIYHGHEVKVSRSDWLAELRDPGKSEAFRPHMHYWWLVAADRSIVRDDLPDGWGLMVPHGGHSLRVVVQATLNATPEPVPHAMAGAVLRASVTTEGALAARAAQPVPAPEVSRGVAEAVREFVHWVAINRAYNGSDHKDGQSLYNECINAALPKWAEEWLRDVHPADDGADCCQERTTAGGCGGES